MRKNKNIPKIFLLDKYTNENKHFKNQEIK